jgi:hypothetical protein
LFSFVLQLAPQPRSLSYRMWHQGLRCHLSSLLGHSHCYGASRCPSTRWLSCSVHSVVSQKCCLLISWQCQVQSDWFLRIWTSCFSNLWSSRMSLS